MAEKFDAVRGAKKGSRQTEALYYRFRFARAFGFFPDFGFVLAFGLGVFFARALGFTGFIFEKSVNSNISSFGP